MGIDITSLAISVTSQGISETAKALDGLTTSAVNVSKALDNTQAPTKKLSDSQKDSADATAKLLAQMQKQVDLLGANTAQTNAYNTVLKTNSTAAQSAAAFLGAEVDAYKALAAAQAEAVKMNKQWDAGIALNIQGLRDQEVAARRAAAGQHEFSLVTAGSTRELLVMSHELATGNLSRFGGSIIVMLERINLMPLAIAKVTTAVEAMGISLAAATGGLLIIVGALVAAGAAVYGFIKSGNQIREFNKELILTGNYAGTTGAAMYDMAVKVGTAAGSISSAKEAVSELAKSGKFSEEQINKITAAAVGLHVYGGVAIKETVDDFIKLAGEPLTGTERSFQRVTKAVLDLDQTKHFLSATVLKEISEADRSGDVLKAQAIAQKAMEDADTSRIEALKKNLSGFQSLTHNVGAWFDRMWQQVTGVESDDSKIKKLKDFLANPGIAVKDATDDASAKLAVLLAKQKAARDKAEADRVQGVKNTNAKIGIEVIDAANKLLKGEETVNEKVQRLRDAFSAQHIAGIKGDLAKEEAIIEAYRIKISAKPKKEPSDGLTGLNASIKEIDAEADVARRKADDEIKVINKKVSLKQTLESDAAVAREKILTKELADVSAMYEKEIKVAQDFHGKTKAQDNEAASIKYGIQDKLEKFTLDSDAKLEINDAKGLKAANAAADAAQKTHDQFMKSIDKETIALKNKVAAYENLPANIKAIGVTEKQLADQITLADIARKEALITSGTLSKQEVANTRLEIAAEQDKMAVQVALEAQQKLAADAMALPANIKKDTEAMIALYKDFGSTIEKSMVGAFGKAGKAAGDMFKVIMDGKDKQLKLDQTIADAQKRIQAGDLSAIDVIDAARNQQGIDALNMYGNMIDASKGFFDQQSGAYKALNAASAVYHAVEVAHALASIPAKLAAGAATMFSQSGWAAFAGVAAMVAVVASFGVSSGGGGLSAADKQAAAGTGSVLGDDKAKSDSIAKSLAIIEKNSGLGLVDSDQMVQSLKLLTDNIAGLASIIVQATGITGVATTDSKTTLSTQLGVIDSKSIDPIMHAVLGKFFSTLVSNKDSGLTFNPQTVASVQASGNLQGSQYSIDETTKKFIFTYSDKINTTLTALGSQVTAQLGLVVNNIASSVSAAAKILGMDGGGFAAHLQQFVIDIGQISTKGLTGDQVQKELEAVFSKLGDDMAAFGVAGLSQFQKVGEGYLETLTRVANDMLQVRDVFTVLGQSITATGVDAIKTSEGLISAAGDLATLTKNTKFFITNFETTAQQMAPIVASVNSAMAALGQSSIKTVQQFSDLVRGLDLNKASDQQLYASLIALAPAFQQAANYAEDVANGTVKLTDAEQRLKDARDKTASLETALIDALNGAGINLIATRKKELAALNATDAAIQQKIYDAQDRTTAANSTFAILSKSVTDAKAVSQAAYNAQIAVITAQKAAAQTAFDSLKISITASINTAKTANTSIASLASSLQSTLNSMSLSSQQISDRQAAQDLISQALKTARSTGVLPSVESISEALRTVAQPADNLFATAVDLARDFNLTKNKITDLNDITNKQKSNSDLQLQALQDSLDVAQKSLDSQNAGFDQQAKAAQATLDAENAKNDSLLSYAQQELDAMNGVQIAVTSVRDALMLFNTAVQSAIAFQKAAGTTAVAGAAVLPGQNAAPQSATNAQIVDMYQNILGRAPDAAGLAWWENQAAHGATPSNIAAAFLRSSEYQTTHGSHANGLDFVPFDNYKANLHAGERVQTAKAARDSDNTAQQIKLMRSEMNAALISIAQSTGSTAKMQKKWDGDGLPSTRDVA